MTMSSGKARFLLIRYTQLALCLASRLLWLDNFTSSSVALAPKCQNDWWQEELKNQKGTGKFLNTQEEPGFRDEP